ncbi:MAG: shikimate dehydrogenase [Deltaproteobacteria bacterium]|nr:shikimate dehydrogenase [Deltaproteobacteria bacterium]
MITAQTFALGVMGDQRVRHSLSPLMHNRVLAGRGLAGVYLAFAVEPAQVGPAIAGMRALGLAGLNVTVPHKQAVIPFLDALAPEAARLGAVNTIVPQPDGRLKGHNTDLGGFLAALAEHHGDPRGQGAVVTGAGGAARAVVAALAGAGASPLYLLARDPAKSQALARELGGEARPWGELAPLVAACPLLVNATAVSAPAESPALAAQVEGLTLPAGGLVLDLNYGRPVNFWRQLAARSGAAFADGLAMLAQQARLSFTLWTGVEATAAEFRQPLEEAHAG